MMDNTMVALKSWGCDIDGAMARFLDDEGFYLEMLVNLCEDEGFLELGKAIEAGKTHDAFEHAHALKGVIGNMGITPMFQTVCAVVEPLRHGEWTNVKEGYATLIEQLEKLRGIAL